MKAQQGIKGELGDFVSPTENTGESVNSSFKAAMIFIYFQKKALSVFDFAATGIISLKTQLKTSL